MVGLVSAHSLTCPHLLALAVQQLVLCAACSLDDALNGEPVPIHVMPVGVVSSVPHSHLQHTRGQPVCPRAQWCKPALDTHVHVAPDCNGLQTIHRPKRSSTHRACTIRCVWHLHMHMTKACAQQRLAAAKLQIQAAANTQTQHRQHIAHRQSTNPSHKASHW
jgi:hypothetical protein